MRVLSLILSLSALAVAAQTPPADKPSDVSQRVVPAVELRTGTAVTPGLKERNGPVISGALVQAARSGDPAQMISPRAPQRFGDGYNNISIDPVTGQGQGIKLFAISF